MWERRASFVAVTGLVLALLIALIGYIALLGFDRGTGTLDNLVSLAIGSVSGSTAGAAAANAAQARQRRSGDETPAIADPSSTPDWPPALPDLGETL